ncbi:flagellar assembly protein A [Campylobacter cuniculorum]|uniref:flagellar assembly protein A n=1 Tax=Campylobacter cuniculorum TaxID=374106 RepID=UPI0023EF73FD|nr:flagellar assembly protein A [Campylobacter cuniculorum]
MHKNGGGVMYKAKTLQTKIPFESLENEEKISKMALDFSVLDYQTLCYKKDSEQEKIYSSKELDIFYNDDFFVEEYESINQEYKIEIHPRTQEKLFRIRLNANEDFTILNAVLLSDEKLFYYEDLKKDILNSLFKQLIKERFLILRLSKNLEQDIERFVQILKESKTQTEFEFKVCRGVAAKDYKMGEMIFHKELSSKQGKQKDMSYDELGYCNPVKKDDLLFEFIYTQEAKSGRNLRGETLMALEEKSLDEPKKLELKDKSIYEKDFEDRVEYYAAHYGFFTYDSLNGYSVSKVLKVESVGLKTTGSIKVDMNEEISLEVSNTNDLNDAVKGGVVNIQVPHVKINGSIGDAKIIAKILNISGGTHRESELLADTAFINIHRGFLEVQNAYIDKLENGKVIAKNVYVKASISSEIEADYIFVEELLPNNKLYPKKALVIEKSLKTGNVIHITPMPYNSNETEYEDLQTLFSEIKLKIKELSKQMGNNYEFLIKNQSNVIRLKKIENKGNLTIVQKKILVTYEKIVQKYNHCVQGYKKLINLYYQIDSKFKMIQKSSYGTEIYIKAKEISYDNILCFNIFDTERIRKKHILNEKDSGKLFYFSQEKMSLISTKNYGENHTENIKALTKKPFAPIFSY